MSERIISESHERALLNLLDDSSPVVQDALFLEVKRLGDVGISLMRKALRDDPVIMGPAAQAILEKLHGPEPVAAVRQFIESLHYDLESGMFLFGRVVQPDLEWDQVRVPLDRIARRVMEITEMPSSGWDRCKALNRVLFHEFGFRGNIEDYEDPLNSFLHTVLRRRKGIPVSLCILYLLVAERCGIELSPIAIPGHFLVACHLDGPPFYVDPFERGRFIPQDELQEHLTRLRLPYDPQWLNPAPISEVLCRVCRNLSNHFNIKNYPRQARIFFSFVRNFDESHRRHSELG